MSVQPLVDSMRGLVSDGILLVQQEVRLARAETAEKVENLQSGIIYLIMGMMLGFCALLILAQALIVVLDAYLGPWAAAVVAGAFLVFTIFFIWRGISLMRPKNLMPHRTAASIQRTAETIRESV